MTTCMASKNPNRPAVSFGASRLLSLASAPTFAAMAVANALGPENAAPLCAPDGGAAHLTGMTAMYALMAVFHLAPWLRLVSCGRAVSPHLKGRSS